MKLEQKALQIAVASLFAGNLLMTGCALSAGPGGAHDDKNSGFSFGLWGDMPYAKNSDEAKIPALIADINSQQLAFSVYDGDTKDGSSSCDDAAIGASAITMFNSMRAPLVYIPGDNEWTDCHRTNNGGYNALERLSFIRQNLFNTDKSFGQNKMNLEHQGALGQAYSENTRWVYKGVMFVGLNIPGSNNNKVNDGACLNSMSARTQADCDADNLEYADRNAHNLKWLHQSFELAKNGGAIGMMVVIQADPGFDVPETWSVNERANPAFSGYTDFLNTLDAETQAYTGQVVLIHGDTHFFKIDKPLINQSNLLKNFTRVETFGSPNVHWIKATVDPNSSSIFRFEPMIVPGN